MEEKKLTPNEERVLNLAKKGVKNNKIAELVGIKYGSVKNILSKHQIKRHRRINYLERKEQNRFVTTISFSTDEKFISKLEKVKGDTFTNKISHLIETSKNFEFLDLTQYKKEYRQEKKERKCISLSREIYHKSLDIKFIENVSLSFVIWFLIKTQYFK